MTSVLAGLAGLAFLAAAAALGLVARARAAAVAVRSAAHALTAPGLDDATREAAARRAAPRLLGLACGLLLRGLATLGAALAVPLLAEAAGLASARRVLALLESWEGLAGVTLFVAAAAWIAARRGRARP